MGISKFLFAAALLSLLPSPIPVAADENDYIFSASGDATKGQRVFNRCKACHNLTASNRTRLGPNLDNLFSKKAGDAAGYKYSRAMRDAEFMWNEAMLNEWLTKPGAFLPGNKMQFAGLRKEQDRKDLIAYLRQATVKAK